MIKSLIFQFSGILLAALLFEWWLLYFSGLGISHYISNTPINVDGLLLLTTIVAVLIFFDKQLLKVDNTISIWKLTFTGTIVCFISEGIFQLVRQPTLNADTLNEKLFYFLFGTLGVTFFSFFLSFFVAFQIKTKRTGVLTLFIFAFMVLCLLLKTLLPKSWLE